MYLHTASLCSKNKCLPLPYKPSSIFARFLSRSRGPKVDPESLWHSALQRTIAWSLAMDAQVERLAEQLQPQLKPARGFGPKLSHISAAILIARDGLDSRAVCAGGRNAVPGVPEGAHDRLSKLARRMKQCDPRRIYPRITAKPAMSYPRRLSRKTCTLTPGVYRKKINGCIHSLLQGGLRC